LRTSSPVIDPLAGLNSDQRKAAEHIGSPLLVLAGPGSGKTRVIVHRIAHRVSDGTEPRRIVALTFTNRAAAELRSRIEVLLGVDAQMIRAGTFHAMCSSLLRRYAGRLGYRSDFALLNPREARAVLRSVLTEAGIADQPLLLTFATAISASKNGAPPAAEAKRLGMSIQQVEEVMGAYQERLRARGALDLDDLLSLAQRLLETQEDVRRSCCKAIQELIVDEYQDTNPVQQRILALLQPSAGTVVAVGDEDQAIYGWRQAGSGAVERFHQAFPDARIIVLHDTYRSTKLILRAAEALIRHNPDRTEKRLRTRNDAGDRPVCFVAEDERGEATWIANEVSSLHDREEVTWHDVAVLYRINAQSRAIEDALLQAGIPYHVVQGQRFYDRPEIRTAVAYLRLAIDASDDAATGFLVGRLPGIGERRLGALEKAAEAAQLPLLAFLHSTSQPPLPGSMRAQLVALADRTQAVRALRDRSVDEVVEAAVGAARTDVEIALAPGQVESALEDLDELGAAMRELNEPGTTLRNLVDRLTLDSGRDAAASGVNLLTLHASKGLEFSAIFISGVEEGLLPYWRSLQNASELEEERRLCYVGMTRARRYLRFSYAHSRFLGGHALSGTPSRFLAEIGPSHLDVRSIKRRTTWPRLHSVAPGDRVAHVRWSAGTVVVVEGAGRETLVTIQFDHNGKQRLQLCYAPLTLLPKEAPGVLAG
jgi:DNA helicase II / ATP-dependent DNA helicase PcrA